MARPILLAVDDDVSVLEAVVQDLRRQYGATYRVMRAASGQAGLDTLNQLKTRQEPVALLLSDQRMPSMTGVEFLERAQKVYPESRRVLLTAYVQRPPLVFELLEVDVADGLASRVEIDRPGGELCNLVRERDTGRVFLEH